MSKKQPILARISLLKLSGPADIDVRGARRLSKVTSAEALLLASTPSPLVGSRVRVALLASRSYSACDMGLVEELDGFRVVVFVGSGGVGKTTAAAAYALRAAVNGKRVLCLTVDPAKRLADSLGLSMGGQQQQQVPQGLFAEHGLHCRGSLTAVMLDRKHTFDNLVAKYAKSPERRQRIFNNRLYQYVSTSLAGTQEYTALEKLLVAYQDQRHDLIVLDTPPTGNALDFLDAPMRLIDAIDSPVPRWFVRMLQGERPLSFLGRTASFILRGLSRFTGTEFLTQVAEFVSDVNDLFGGFRNRAAEVYGVLRGEDVAFVVVAGPFIQALADAVFFSRKLDDYQIRLKGVVVNRVHPPVQVSEFADSQIAEWLGDVITDGCDAADLAHRMRQAALDACLVAESDRVNIERLRQQIGKDIHYTEVPAFDRDVHDLAALAETSRYL